MAAVWASFLDFVRTPAGVLAGIGLGAVLVGVVYDCVLQYRINRNDEL